jgi:hypothetical protein
MTWQRACLALAVALALWLGGFAAFCAHVATQARAPLTQGAEAIIVLTGAPGRVETGVALLRAGVAPRLFISGVHPDATVAEVIGPANADLAHRVTLGKGSATTAQNAAEVNAWLRGRNRALYDLRLITSTYHMPRARVEMAHALPDGVRVAPHAIPDPRFAEPGYALLALMWGEYHKLLWRCAVTSLAPPRGQDSGGRDVGPGGVHRPVQDAGDDRPPVPNVEGDAPPPVDEGA